MHVIQIQHADNVSNRKDNYNTLNISSDARHMSKFSAMMRQAHKENAEQNEDSNQHTSSHHDIHLKSHVSNSVSYIQCSNQINLDTQNCSLTHRSECEWIRNDTLKLQEQTDQKTSQDAKQISISHNQHIQDHADDCFRNRNTHFLAWSISEH